MCGGGSTPVDKSAEVAQINADAAAAVRAEEAQKAAAAKEAFAGKLSGAYSTGIAGAKDYFSSQGLNADDYLGKITTAANTTRSGIPDLDGNPSDYFSNLGQVVFDREQDSFRNGSLRSFDSFARDGFAKDRIGSDADDAHLAAILEEQRAEGREYIQRMVDRGIITEAGAAAATKDLDRQAFTAKSQLESIGQAQLEKGRGDLRTIAADGRSAASNLRLGDSFDPFSYQSDIEDSSNNFFASLADTLRGLAPTDLFDTSGLANIAGAAQGAQNTEFDPNLTAGLFTELGEDEDESTDLDLEDEDDEIVFAEDEEEDDLITSF